MHVPPIEAVLVLLTLVGAYVALGVYPHDLPAPGRHPDFVATVLQSRPLVFAGRITLPCLRRTSCADRLRAAGDQLSAASCSRHIASRSGRRRPAA